MGVSDPLSNCTPTPVAVPTDPNTDATPEFPDADVNVTATLTPDWQLMLIENGVLAPVAPTLPSIDGLIVASEMV